LVSQDDVLALGALGLGVILWSTGTLQKLVQQVQSSLNSPAQQQSPLSSIFQPAPQPSGRQVTTTRGINPMQVMGGIVPTIGAVMGGGGVSVGTIYPALSHAPNPNPGGKNENIHYASSGKAAISHRNDVSFPGKPNLEATCYLAWPSGCSGGGHPELAIKFWGPPHTDSTCCYAYTSAVPQGGQLAIGVGGEGPHPSTTTLQQTFTRIPFQTGKVYGIKGVIWALPGGGAHQESWFDLGGGRWQKAGQRDAAAIGKDQTSRNINPNNTQIEFRIDCSNVTYQHTDVAEINPGGAAALGGAGYIAYAGFNGSRRFKHRSSMITDFGTSAPPGYPLRDNIEN
jgi:hypothetical protein